jgi:predicted ribosome quality control (RQC) complex YloA/Tae2 family protein
MGKHSNLMLVDSSNKVIAAAKWVGATKSKRPILPNHVYAPPPFDPKPSLIDASPEQDLRDFEGASPFLVRLIGKVGLEPIQEIIRKADFHPVFSEGNGAYPVSVAPLNLAEVARKSFSQALEQHFEWLGATRKIEQVRASLLSQLRRVQLAREVAMSDLEQAADAAARAGELQLRGQLLLAHASTIPPEASQVELYDYEGNLLTIRLNPDLSPIENANRLFDKAKRAKGAAEVVHEQLARMQSDHEQLGIAILRAEDAESVADLEEVQVLADERRWLHHQPAPTRTKEERPYQGHSIRELIAPGGWRVLYGEKAEANDFLTTRVAKPNDWWLHVRGGASAHVIIVTQNHPEKVSREALMFAAKVAVMHSPSKHSGYVPVDYCLKKHVRRPRGAAPGTALYTQEKTLHID